MRIPACAPLKLTASSPIDLTAIATSAQLVISPVESRASNSRDDGLLDTSEASSMSLSVVSPIAETTTATPFPPARADAMRPAAFRIFSASARDVPPYFCTILAILRTSISAPPAADSS